MNVPGRLERGKSTGLPVAAPTFIPLLRGPAWSEGRGLEPAQNAVRAEEGV